MTQPPGYGAPITPEHPEASKLLVLSIVGLLCCGPIAIYTLIQSNSILQNPNGFNVSKVNTVKILSIIALALWAISAVSGAVYNLTTMGS